MAGLNNLNSRFDKVLDINHTERFIEVFYPEYLIGKRRQGKEAKLRGGQGQISTDC